MSDIRVDSEGNPTILRPGLPWHSKSVLGKEIDGIVADYYDGDIVQARKLAEARYAELEGWWHRSLVPVVSDENWDTEIAYDVQGFRTRYCHKKLHLLYHRDKKGADQMKYLVTVMTDSPKSTDGDSCPHQHRTETGALRCALNYVIRDKKDAVLVSSKDGDKTQFRFQVLKIGD